MMIFQFIFFQAIVFGAVIFFLKKILYGDTQTAVNRLGHAYQDLLQKQQEMSQKIEAAEKEYVEKKNEAMTIGEKLKMQALDEARQKEDEILKKARGQAEEIISKAHGAKEEICRELEKEFSKRLVDISAKIIGKTYSPTALQGLHDQMVEEFFLKIKEAQLAGIELAGKETVIRSPYPLDEKKKEILSRLLAEKFKIQIDLKEKEDKELIAGMALQFGTLMLDGSLAGALRDAAARVKESV